MGEIRRALIGVMLLATCIAALYLGAGAAENDPPGDRYWMVYQPSTPWPTYPDLWLFSPAGQARVALRAHNGSETEFVVAGCRPVRFPLKSLGASQLDWGMFVLDVKSDREVWITGEHRKPDGSHVADPGLARPHRGGYTRNLVMGAGWARAGYTRIVVNAPSPAVLTMRAWGGPYHGWDFDRTRTRTVHGAVVIEPYYEFDLNGSFVVEIQSDTPVAMEVMNAGGFERWDLFGNDYLPDWVRLSGIHAPAAEYIMDRDVTFAGARFPEGGGTLEVFDASGARLFQDAITRDRGKAWGTSAGTSADSPYFPSGPQRWVGSAAFAPDIAAPTRAEQTLDSATFFGFRADKSRLHVFNDAATSVAITAYDGLRPDRFVTFEVPARSAAVRRLTDLGLGLAETAPFLLAVRASRPVFTSVEIDRMGGFLRPYPFGLFSTCPDPTGPGGATLPCLEIKVPPAGRKRVSGACLAVMADVCGETGSPVAARRAVASVRFEYRIGAQGDWNLIPAPDATHPWLVHWDVTALPETIVQIRAVGADSSGATRASEPREVTIDHSNWEIRSRCASGPAAGAGEARVARGAAVEMTAGGVEVRGDSAITRTVRVVAAADALGADDVLRAEVVSASAVDTAPLPPGWIGIGEFREVNVASGASALAGPVDLFLSYVDVDGDGVVDGTGIPAAVLRGFSLDDAGVWSAVETVGVDTGAREVHLRTAHFTLFGLAAPSSFGGGDGGTCLVARSDFFGRARARLRAARDLLLATNLGRRFVALYY